MKTMEVGAELDALVAEKVFAWEWWRSKASGRRCLFPPGSHPEWFTRRATGDERLVVDWAINPSRIPTFSADIAAAWAVVEHLDGDGQEFSIERNGPTWKARFNTEWAGDVSPCVAICWAALRAVGVDVEQPDAERYPLSRGD